MRLIVNNKTPITLSQRDTIREGVGAAAGNMSTTSLTPVDEQEAFTSGANVTEEHFNATQPFTQAFLDPSWKEGLRIEMRQAVAQIEGTEPMRRPAIPRVNTSKNLAIMVAIMNADVLPPYIELAVDLESWTMLIYCGDLYKHQGIKQP